MIKSHSIRESQYLSIPPYPLYGQKVIETDFGGDKRIWESHGHTNAFEARKFAFDMAKKDGWKEPKWWQFWRWGDTREII
jgi:hypothetical protein